MTLPDSRMDPVNAVGRFLLELVAVYGIWRGVDETTGSWIAGVLVAGTAMAVWGTFRVPDDPGPAPRPVPGVMRLAIEVLVLGGGSIGLWIGHGVAAGSVYAVVLVLHYATTTRRLRHVLSFR